MTSDGATNGRGPDDETRQWRERMERWRHSVDASLEQIKRDLKPLVNEHDEEAIRRDERGKISGERRAWWRAFLRDFGGIMGIIGTAVGVAVGIYALFGGGP